MLSGENGILNKAATAKIETEKASAEEKIKLAVMSALTAGNGKIQGEEAFKTLNDELKDVGYEGEEIKDLPKTVTIDGNDYVIDIDGTVGEPVTIASLKESGKPVTQEKVTLEDKNRHTITIPKNFNIASESQEEVTTGMIIEDSEDNQYVWIPVFAKEQYDWGVDWSATKTAEEVYESNKTEENETAYYTAIQTALKSYTSTYKSSYCTDVWYGNTMYGKYGYYAENDIEQASLIYYTNGDMTKDEYNILYRNMLKSVYKNGGFYIGRYEMGIVVVESTDEAQAASRTIANEEYVSGTTNSTNQKPTIEGMTAPLSKANAVPYNYITQSQAQMLAEKLEENSDYSNVESSIMFGVQWDAVCVFIEHFDTNNTAGTKSQWLYNNAYSKLWGNYNNSTFKLDQGFYTTTYSTTTVIWNKDYTTVKGTTDRWLCTTGASKQNSSLNIYDLGGNLAEWTLERYNKASNPCHGRGIGFNATLSACGGINGLTFARTYDISSRTSLYIK